MPLHLEMYEIQIEMTKIRYHLVYKKHLTTF